MYGYISGRAFNEQIEEIQINENNPNFIVSDKCLYNKDKTKLYLCFAKDTTITLEEGITTVYAYAFHVCKTTQTLNLPDSVTTIYGNAFANMPDLENILFGKNLQRIINPMFSGNNKLKNIEIDAENPNYMVENCVIYNEDKTKLISMQNYTLTNFEIPSGVKEIDRYAFYSIDNIKEIIISNSVIDIGERAFYNCKNLTKVEIPNSTQTIGINAFLRCDNLKEVIINKEKGSIVGSPWGCIYGERVIKWLK